jgi:hypothetical protein
MLLELLRFATTEDATAGALYIDGVFECFTVEDGWNANKVAGETRIHPGLYEVGVRQTGGSFNPKYAERYPFHAGMLHLLDVPEFTWVYIHTGNTPEHTKGCLLVNESITAAGTGAGSRMAYANLYPKVIESALAGDLTIRIRDYA